MPTTTELTTGDRLRRLKEMGGLAGRNIFNRINLAREVIADQSYLDAKHDGDSLRAAEFLEGEFFPDLGGSYTLWHLVEIIRAFPNERAWQENRYNLRAMDRLYRTTRPGSSAAPPEPTTAPTTARRRGSRVAAEIENQELKQALIVRKSEVEQLREENERLRQENIDLRARLAQVSEGVARSHEDNGSVEE